MKQLLLVMVLLWSVGIQANYLTGNELQRWCIASKGAKEYEFCGIYLAGIADAAKAYSNWGYKDNYRDTPSGSCIPGGVSLAQVRQAWLKRAKANPDDLHLGASSLALNAFEVVWPCMR